MEELKKLLNLILEVSNQNINNEEKHNLMANLWTKFYKLSNDLDIKLDEEYNVSLLVEQSSFILNQNLIKKDIDYNLLNESITKIENNTPILENEAINILNWTVLNAKENLKEILKCLGKDINDSLSGFCEITQAISLIPLENIGIKVTKNTAKDSFGYLYNHAFGTATFNIISNEKIIEKTYLIDISYKQFFSTSKCNYGYYYKKDAIAPDPGYFADKEFARKLLANGYIELNSETAIKYGKPFCESCRIKSNINFYNNIINKGGNYSAKETDLEDFNLELPNYKSKN